MKLPQNTFNKRKLFGCALAVDKSMREKDLLLPLYPRHERPVLMHIRPSLLELMMHRQDLGRFHTDLMILCVRDRTHLII